MGAFEGVDVSTAVVLVSTAIAITQPLNLYWQPVTDPVAGYYIYYGPTPDTANVLLSDLPAGSYDPAAPSVSYDPVRDLGMYSGSSVCFNIFAYDTARVLSGASELVCTVV